MTQKAGECGHQSCIVVSLPAAMLIGLSPPPMAAARCLGVSPVLARRPLRDLGVEQDGRLSLKKTCDYSSLKQVPMFGSAGSVSLIGFS